ncbi:unnamed protein product [Rhizoctonia solani]|uniref:Uncharacterized protein n=1 Tax=Rhizoctonia solani TaxID=456999 RepID=A0A8H2XTQ0_9AGAM|nr:unnamed protein product [Rhizoctonia solani]
MGYITNSEIKFEDEQDPISPPQSPRLVATHAQAITEKVASTNSDLDNTVAHDYAVLCCEEFSLTDTDKAAVLQVSQNPKSTPVALHAFLSQELRNLNPWVVRNRDGLAEHWWIVIGTPRIPHPPSHVPVQLRHPSTVQTRHI